MKKKILIFGITGQDGSHLAKLYVKKKCIVHGISRKKRGSFKNLIKLNILNKVKIYKIDKDFSILKNILKFNYDYIYFLGGQSSVIKSYVDFEHETFDSVINPLRIILEFIRNQKKKSKFMFSASSEIFGSNYKNKLKISTTKKPLSPYGLSKLIGFEIVKSYREMFNLPFFSIIFFNHESSLRGDDYVIKKISNYLKDKKFKKNQKLKLGNINVIRDWGWAPEYMEILSKIMSRRNIDDYIIATGKSVSLKKIIKIFFKKNKLNYKKFIIIKKNYIRKFEVKENYADIRKLKKELNLKPTNTYKHLINLI